MYIHEIDYLVEDLNTYAKAFKKIKGYKLTHAEWFEIRGFVRSTRIKKPVVENWQELIKTVSDLYSDIFSRFNAKHSHIHTLVRFEWAHHVGIISTEELDLVKKMWRKTC